MNKESRNHSENQSGETRPSQPKASALGIVRHVLTFAGGALVTLIGIVWSILQKRQVSISRSFSIAAPIALALGLTGTMGCKSLPQDQTARIAGLAKVASYVGTAEALRSHPEWLPGFQVARDELTVLEAAEVIDYVTLIAIIQRLPVRELKGDRAILLITSATLLIQELGNPAIPLDQVPQLRPIVSAIRQGIDLGLSQQ